MVGLRRVFARETRFGVETPRKNALRNQQPSWAKMTAAPWLVKPLPYAKMLKQRVVLLVLSRSF